MQLTDCNGLDEEGGGGWGRKDEEVPHGELLGGSALGKARDSTPPLPCVVLTLSFMSLHTAAKVWVLLSRSSQSNFQNEVGFRIIGSPNSCKDTCEGKLATIPAPVSNDSHTQNTIAI